MAITLARFGREIAALGKRLEHEAAIRLTSRAADETLRELRAASPVRSGALKSSWVKQRGRSKRRGQWIVGARMSVAPHANVVLPGRRRGKRGFMIGSKQTGRGHVVRKVRKRIDAQIDAYVRGTVGRLF